MNDNLRRIINVIDDTPPTDNEFHRSNKTSYSMRDVRRFDAYLRRGDEVTICGERYRRSCGGHLEKYTEPVERLDDVWMLRWHGLDRELEIRGLLEPG